MGQAKVGGWLLVSYATTTASDLVVNHQLQQRAETTV